jgi:hypothetical protein
MRARDAEERILGVDVGLAQVSALRTRFGVWLERRAFLIIDEASETGLEGHIHARLHRAHFHIVQGMGDVVKETLVLLFRRVQKSIRVVHQR